MEFTQNGFHSHSITVFDILTSFNIIRLVSSTICNLLDGNNMPFNKIKCPNCQSEEYSLIKNSDKELACICKVCNTHYNIALDNIIRDI